MKPINELIRPTYPLVSPPPGGYALHEARVDNGWKDLSLIYVQIVSGAAIFRGLNKIWQRCEVFIANGQEIHRVALWTFEQFCSRMGYHPSDFWGLSEWSKSLTQLRVLWLLLPLGQELVWLVEWKKPTMILRWIPLAVANSALLLL